MRLRRIGVYAHNRPQSMIPKSGNRFSDKIMLKGKI
jgi:hypothetical protein